MPNRKNILIISVLAVLSACRSHLDGPQLLEVDNGLTHSFAFMTNSAEAGYASLAHRMFKAPTDYSVDLWLGIARNCKTSTYGILNYIESTKGEFHGSSISRPKARALFDTLLKYRYSLSASLPDSDAAVKHGSLSELKTLITDLPLLHSVHAATSNESDFTSWMNETFNENPLITILALDKLKIDVATCNLMIIQYCESKTQPAIERYSILEPVALQNAAVLRPGEVLNIKAGVAESYPQASPDITINGTSLPLNSRAWADYKMKVPAKPGKYKIPVTINFLKPNGFVGRWEYTVSYEVTSP